jgi:hypothetical protein
MTIEGEHIMKQMICILICILITAGINADEIYDSKIISHNKSEARAFSYSALGTIATIVPGILIARKNQEITPTSGVLLATGYLFGPGVGHIYANNSSRFWIGSGIRFSAVLLFLYGASNVDIFDSSNSNDEAAAVGILGGMALGAFGIFRDFATVDNSVREYNERLETSQFSIAPSLYTQDENLTFGLQFKLTR